MLNGEVNVYEHRKRYNSLFVLFGFNNQNRGQFCLYFRRYNQWITIIGGIGINVLYHDLLISILETFQSLAFVF